MITKLILYLILGSVYIIVYPFKIKRNKVTFISLTSDKLEKDFELLANELEKRQKFKIHYVLFKFDNTLKAKIKYLISCMIQVYQINTSSLVILDYNNYVVSHFKKKSVKVLQVWHASGAIKQFGNDIEREYPIKNYDYVLSTSDVWKTSYSKAFGIKEEQVISLGLPLNDNLHNEAKLLADKLEMYKTYPQIKDKKVVLYAPTFRGHNLTGPRYQPINLDEIQNQLGDDYVVMYKLHPIVKMDLPHNNRVINVRHENLLALYSVADYLITDYSAILFDFSILKRPIISFAPDLAQYQQEVGMYIDYEAEIPAPICVTEQEVIDVIKQDRFDLERVEAFSRKYFKYHDANSTKRIADFIEEMMTQ